VRGKGFKGAAITPKQINVSDKAQIMLYKLGGKNIRTTYL
jgi:hypothetical protein